MFGKFRESKLFTVLSNKFVLVLVAYTVWVVWFDPNSLADWYKVRRSVSEQNRQIRYYKKEIMSIEKKLSELNSNLDSLEKFAREQYYFKNPDEEIFIVAPSVPESH